jgi:hypothetical protein
MGLDRCRIIKQYFIVPDLECHELWSPKDRECMGRQQSSTFCLVGGRLMVDRWIILVWEWWLMAFSWYWLVLMTTKLYKWNNQSMKISAGEPPISMGTFPVMKWTVWEMLNYFSSSQTALLRYTKVCYVCLSTTLLFSSPYSQNIKGYKEIKNFTCCAQC